MQQALRPSALVPLGFVVENATYEGATTGDHSAPREQVEPVSGMRHQVRADP
jgi:hypothetical protein